MKLKIMIEGQDDEPIILEDSSEWFVIPRESEEDEEGNFVSPRVSVVVERFDETTNENLDKFAIEVPSNRRIRIAGEDWVDA